MKKSTVSSMQRLTKIICTLGPTSGTFEQIEALARGGMAIARINLSHATWADHKKTIDLVKKVNAKLAKEGKTPTSIGILLDTKGAEVRTGKVEKPLKVKRGELVVFSPKPLPNERKQVVIVDHKKFSTDVQDAERILIDNGKMSFELVSVRGNGSIVARAREEGTIGSRRHVNLPGANLDMPSLTKDDWESIAHGADAGVDFLGLSFVREAKDIEDVRKYLDRRGVHIELVAKIETRQAVKNMQEIIDVSDGVMVARGDLGAEIPFEQMPVVQDEIVSRSRKAGKPVIVATHMLESMIENPIPTRAEVTDIAHAATIATDTTMLSGETANGAHPLEALDAMSRVLAETERHLSRAYPMRHADIRSPRDARAQAAVTLAISSQAAAIVVVTRSGASARELSRFRPAMPIFAFTPTAAIDRFLQMCYGVTTFVSPFSANPEKTITDAIKRGKKAGVLKKGQNIVIVADAKAGAGNVNTIQIREVL